MRPDKRNIFSLASTRGEIKVKDFSSILLVKARVGHAHDMLCRPVIPEEAALSAAKNCSPQE